MIRIVTIFFDLEEQFPGTNKTHRNKNKLGKQSRMCQGARKGLKKQRGMDNGKPL